ncbi:2'-5'-oligoadenylate synthase 1A-like [Mesocricetus auratus]|uniref:2'-5'-oligoadenylate synthase 1A-like n=1 Tax=Mesocricetus auratus TaxID=10036 RepID=A0ABM2WHP5_MESAU|nr:2'-5'-oligoadenylate synthase 1A-like [Mesocricetus auratus]
MVFLIPETNFHFKVKAEMKTICALLKERCFQGGAHPVWVSKVVKVNSNGDSERKGRLESDLVVFFTNLHTFENYLYRWGVVIEEIKEHLHKFQREKDISLKLEVESSKQPNPQALSFKLIDPDQEGRFVKFDVLLAYNVLGQFNYIKPSPKIYTDLISERTSKKLEDKFATCLMVPQRIFLGSTPNKLKYLRDRVKDWYQTCKKKLGKPLPPLYALELLTFYAWEYGSGVSDFNTTEGFKTVLELVTKYRQLRIYWTMCYDIKLQHRQLSGARPVILDPADPATNVAGLNADGWCLLAEEAMTYLDSEYFKYWDGSPVGSWDVPVIESWACVLL